MKVLRKQTVHIPLDVKRSEVGREELYNKLKKDRPPTNESIHMKMYKYITVEFKQPASIVKSQSRFILGKGLLTEHKCYKKTELVHSKKG